jgi:hypothetical protein
LIRTVKDVLDGVAAEFEVTELGWVRSFTKRVARVAMPGQLKSEIAPLLAVFESINRQLVWVDSRLEHLAKSDETVERLCTAPSVGRSPPRPFPRPSTTCSASRARTRWRPISDSRRASGARA